MKVILVNGSPHHHGCTYTALEEVAKVLNSQGIETEHFWVGTKPIMGCIGCGKCVEACPFGLAVKAEDSPVSSKCIACGICAKACPMDVLEVVEK